MGTTEKTTEIENQEVKQELESEKATEIVDVKPYTFRKLGSSDIFLMFKIISKIGINEFKTVFNKAGIKDIIAKATAKESEDETQDETQDETSNEDVVTEVGISIVLEAVNVILEKLPNCEAEIYQLLSQTSNLSVDEIKAEGNAVMFLEMVIDFFKKDEFPDFIKVVSKLFK